MVMSSMGTSHSGDSEDAWGHSTTSIMDPSRLVTPQSATVPDDWDADDNEEEPDGKTLWVTANSRSPMPEIQLSTTSSSTSVSLPPPAAFEAPLRILKRPSSTNSKSPSPSSGAQTPKSFKEREAQYQAARERIFGEEASRKDKDGNGNGKPKTALDSAKSSIIRDPLGPAIITDGETKHGFRARRKKGFRVAETGTPTTDNSNNHLADT